MRTRTETKTLRFLITNLGRDEVILGYPWLTAFEPVIHWKDVTLDKKCQPVVISSIQPEDTQIAALTTEEEWEEIAREEEEPYAILRKTTTALELAQKAMDKTKKTFEQMVPEEYRRHTRTFNEKESHRFPPPRPWDHAIELLPDTPKAFDCKVYPMARGEEDSLREFIDKQLKKGYIRPSKSPYVSPFFFIKKKDGKLRLVQDYRKLNLLTVKNQYPLPLIPELIDKLRNATLFTKLDIRWGYNNVRIKEGDQEKGAFKTNLGLYEPCVMFFGLTNSLSTFQTMMDTIFRDLTATGEVVIYMDDILIATPSNTPHHRQLVHQVLDRLHVTITPYLSWDMTYYYRHCKGISRFPLLLYHPSPRPMLDRITSASLTLHSPHATLLDSDSNPITYTASWTVSFLPLSLSHSPLMSS